MPNKEVDLDLLDSGERETDRHSETSICRALRSCLEFHINNFIFNNGPMRRIISPYCEFNKLHKV